MIDPGSEKSQTSMKKRLEEYLEVRKKEPFEVSDMDMERVQSYEVVNFEPEVDRRKGTGHKTAVSVKLRRTRARSCTDQIKATKPEEVLKAQEKALDCRAAEHCNLWRKFDDISDPWEVITDQIPYCLKKSDKFIKT